MRSLLPVLLLTLAVALCRADEPPVDPFATPPSMRSARGRVADGVAAAGSASALALLPPVAVKGSCAVPGRPTAALLGLGDQVHLVRAGDRLTVVKDGLELTLLVARIEAGAVTLRLGAEAGPEVVVR